MVHFRVPKSNIHFKTTCIASSCLCNMSLFNFYSSSYSCLTVNIILREYCAQLPSTNLNLHLKSMP